MHDDLFLAHWERAIEERIFIARFLAAAFHWLDGEMHFALVDVGDIPPGVWEEVEFWRGEPFL